jgi:hypothetical protein
MKEIKYTILYSVCSNFCDSISLQFRIRFWFRNRLNYGSSSDFLTHYGSGSGSASQKVTVSTDPVPVPQRWSMDIVPITPLAAASDPSSRIYCCLLPVVSVRSFAERTDLCPHNSLSLMSLTPAISFFPNVVDTDQKYIKRNLNLLLMSTTPPKIFLLVLWTPVIRQCCQYQLAYT